MRFMNLVQGTLSIDEYKDKFVRLSQYVPELVSSEVNCCKRFKFRLNREIKLYLVAQNTKVFDELVEKAHTLEEALGEKHKVALSGAVKRSIEAGSGYGRKIKDRQAVKVEASPANQGAAAWQICEYCTRCHRCECWRMTSACLICGSMGHRVSDCSRKPLLFMISLLLLLHLLLLEGETMVEVVVVEVLVSMVLHDSPARVCTVREPRTREATDVIAGTSTLQSFPLLASIDSGVMRSFMLRDVVRELGIAEETSRLNVTVKSSLGYNVVVDRAKVDYEVKVELIV
ncbi:uncharacterized protein LOC108451262 [Gossypium arboreum]|uniref:uncharacterized protein LOC108451262 n=1 Tax=Gossypium arboreum TaxID=29729 RepID=UPI00081908BD|nr:uncharacterized protein LOC108451262 [Gossypium arboreum]